MEKKYELLMDDTIRVYGIITLYRIRALKDFGDVKKGDLGGYIQKESNLSHNGNCWIYDEARVYINAKVHDDARIFGNAKVHGSARIFDNVKVCGSARIFGHADVCNNAEVFGKAGVHGSAKIFGNAKVHGSARIFGHADVCNNAEVFGKAEVFGSARIFGNAKVHGSARIFGHAYISSTRDYITIGPIGSRDDYTTFYKTKDKGIWVKCGCFDGSIDKFEKTVLETHRDNDEYRTQYIDAINYAIKHVNV